MSARSDIGPSDEGDMTLRRPSKPQRGDLRIRLSDEEGICWWERYEEEDVSARSGWYRLSFGELALPKAVVDMPPSGRNTYMRIFRETEGKVWVRTKIRSPSLWDEPMNVVPYKNPKVCAPGVRYPLYRGPEPVREGFWWYLPNFTKAHHEGQFWAFEILAETPRPSTAEHRGARRIHRFRDPCNGRCYDPEMIVKKSIGAGGAQTTRRVELVV